MSQVPLGGGVIIPGPGIVITQPTSGVFVGLDGRCTHAGCLVGTISHGLIQCPCHGSAFSVTDGSVVNGPAQRPLASSPVKVVSGYLYRA